MPRISVLFRERSVVDNNNSNTNNDNNNDVVNNGCVGAGSFFLFSRVRFEFRKMTDLSSLADTGDDDNDDDDDDNDDDTGAYVAKRTDPNRWRPIKR